MSKTGNEKSKSQKIASIKYLLKVGFYNGLGWAFGATIGFAIISSILIVVLNQLGGMPIVGNFFASIVQSTIDQLTQRTPILPN